MLQLLGLRIRGLAAAAIFPILPTAALFLGPLSLLYFDWLSRRPIQQLNRSLLEVRPHLKSTVLSCPGTAHPWCSQRGRCILKGSSGAAAALPSHLEVETASFEPGMLLCSGGGTLLLVR